MNTITYKSVTKVGDREQNEDSLLCVEHDSGAWYFVVADGLGGHGRGEVASKMLVDAFKSVFDAKSQVGGGAGSADGGGNYSTQSLLDESFLTAQERILAEQKLSGVPNEMKTTAVALAIADGKCRFGHIGDSRLYLFGKNGKYIKRTLDHSVPQMLVMAKEIREKDISHHPDRNRLLRVVGTYWDTPKYELSDEFPLSDFGAALLCSDGFWEWIDEKAMREYLKKSASADDWLDMMLTHVEDGVVRARKAMSSKKASTAKGTSSLKKDVFAVRMDNYTAVAVRGALTTHRLWGLLT